MHEMNMSPTAVHSVLPDLEANLPRQAREQPTTVNIPFTYCRDISLPPQWEGLRCIARPVLFRSRRFFSVLFRSTLRSSLAASGINPQLHAA